MLLLIDNYDSFVYNLSRYVQEIFDETQVVRNDAIDLDGIRALNPAALVLSPGPCGPNEAGICLDVVREFAGKIPILGVCLGHQVIAQSFGGTVRRSHIPVHGKASIISHSGTGLFHDLPDALQVGRYHSLSVELLEDGPLIANAHSQDGEIMALHHKEFPIWGVQFHPESILTPQGHDILRNFLRCANLLP